MPMSPRLLRPRQAGGFSPRSISGLAAWFDSTDNSTITTSTGVSSWADKSGNGYAVSQGTGANQPTLSSINGRQAFLYNGSSQILTTADAGLTAVGNSATNAAPPNTVFYVARLTVNHLGITAAWGNSAVDTPFHAAIHTSLSPLEWRGSYRTDANSPQFTSSGFGVVEGNYVVSSTLGSGGISGRVNGAQAVTLALPGGNLAVTVNRFAIGGLQRIGTSIHWNGRIGDVIVYNRVLSASEIRAVEQWLGAKYGITVAL